MKLLAFDTSSTACSIALLNDGDVQVIHKIAPMQQAQIILPLIQELLDTSALSLNQLDALVFGCGPGSFTGIRIASSVAQALGYASELPIIRISSLAAIAQTAYDEQQWNQLLVAVDARMEQIYWANYTVDEHQLVRLEGREQTCLPQEIQPPKPGTWYGVGDGWLNYQANLIQYLGFTPQAINSSQLPHARALLKLAQPKFEQRDWVLAKDAIPVYLR